VLTAIGSKSKGNKVVDLEWFGISGRVTIRRNGDPVDLPTNGTTATDSLGKGGGTYAYQVCSTSSPEQCSNVETVVF
jgi:hypothetical protein